MNTVGAVTDDHLPPVTVVGLGLMGSAIAQCYVQKGYEVHAWNRGKSRREAASNAGIHVYETLQEALSKSNLIIMSVVGDCMLSSAASLIQSIPASQWKGKTLVQFSSHEPTAIKTQERLVQSLGANLIGGAMMAVPETVGTKEGVFLVSANDPEIIQTNLSYLQVLGRVVVFDGGDVGLASLADIGFLQSIQFGVAGNELSCLIFERYGVNDNFRKTYLELVPSVVPPIYLQCASFASKAVFADEYQEMAKTFLRASSHLAVLETHQFFYEQMGLKEETFLSLYLKKFRKVPDLQNVGPAAIVKEYHFS